MNIYKKTLILLIVFITMSQTASATTGMTADQLRTEIARLTRVADSIRYQLLKFGDNPDTVQPNINNPSTPINYGGTACLQSNLRMKKGDSGGSISTLQQFLVQQGVYSASLVTGYFGPATQAGTQRWQAAHGVISYGTPITTGYGLVGPGTLRAMHAGCQGGVYNGPSGSLISEVTTAPGAQPKTAQVKEIAVERYSLSLNPTRGIAPLNVTVDFSIAGSTCTSYVFDWGDGSLPISYNSNKSTACTPLSIKITRTHRYTRSGTHTIKFKNGKAPITKISTVNNLKVEIIGSQ